MTETSNELINEYKDQVRIFKAGSGRTSRRWKE